MSIVLTCGQNSGYLRAHKTLVAAGLKEAVPSRHEKYSPTDISRAICESYKIDLADPAAVNQIEPGKVWQALSGDLMLANFSQPDWGWADPNTIYLLNYWRDYDPLIKFVLTYSSPEHAVAELFAKAPPSSEAVEQGLSIWRAVNSSLLSFYSANKDRAILVNSSSISKNANHFIELARGRLGVGLVAPSGASFEAKEDAIPNLLASLLIEGTLDAQSLYRELESAADMPGYANQERKSLAYKAWGQYQGHKVQLKDALISSEIIRTECNEQKQCVGQHEAEILRLHRQRDEKDQKQKREVSELQARIDQLGVGRNEQSQENELLLLQLHQVQEELEHYFLKYQEATNPCKQKDGDEKAAIAAIEEKKTTADKTTEVVIDMRQFIDGDNWYYAEHDGRWAGPEKNSTLRLPKLDRGQYRLELDFVDAIAPDIIKNMKVSLDGKPLKITGGGGLVGPWASVVTLYKKKLKYPLLLISQIRIGANEADKNHILEFSFPNTTSPASRGADDMRELAVRLRQVKLSRT